MKNRICLILVCVFVFVSCVQRKNVSVVMEKTEGAVLAEKIVMMNGNIKSYTEKNIEYAKNFEIFCFSESDKKSGSKLYLVTVKDESPYFFCEADFTPELPDGITLMKGPFENIYMSSSTAISCWNRLDALDKIKYCSLDRKSWYIPEVIEAMDKGEIKFIGKYRAPDYEILLNNNVTTAIESTMIYQAQGVKEKLESIGVNVFVDRASYETEPLARLEWIKIYGLLCGKEEEADKFFASQVELANKINSGTVKKESKPCVSFFYINSSGKVTIRNREDYISNIIRMAGCNYLFPEDVADITDNPSYTISVEAFYELAQNADYLIYNTSIDGSVTDMESLAAKNELFKDFEAFRKGNVWAVGKNFYQQSDSILQMVYDIYKVTENLDDEKFFLENLK